jgi:hypothetical protein
VYVADGFVVAGIIDGVWLTVEIVLEGPKLGTAVEITIGAGDAALFSKVANEIAGEGDENIVGAAVGGANEIGFTHRGGSMGLQLPLEQTKPGLQHGLDALHPAL